MLNLVAVEAGGPVARVVRAVPEPAVPVGQAQAVKAKAAQVPAQAVRGKVAQVPGSVAPAQAIKALVSLAWGEPKAKAARRGNSTTSSASPCNSIGWIMCPAP